MGQYTAAATAYPAPAPGTAVPVGYSAAAAASAATSYAAARPAAPSVLPAAYSAYPQVGVAIEAGLLIETVSRQPQHMLRLLHLLPPLWQQQGQHIPIRPSMQQPLACQQQHLGLLQSQQLTILKLLWRQASPTLLGTQPTTRLDPHTATRMPKWLLWRHDNQL